MTTDSLLNIKKLLDFAVQLEVIGEKFFGHWAVKADTDELKKFFRFLAEEESNHKKTFEELKQKVAVTKIDIPENQEGFEDDFEIFASTILYNEREMETVKDLAAAIALLMSSAASVTASAGSFSVTSTPKIILASSGSALA